MIDQELYRMTDPEMASWVVLLAGKESSDWNTAEVPCAATKTIENRRPWLQKQLGR